MSNVAYRILNTKTGHSKVIKAEHYSEEEIHRIVEFYLKHKDFNIIGLNYNQLKPRHSIVGGNKWKEI